MSAVAVVVAVLMGAFLVVVARQLLSGEAADALGSGATGPDAAGGFVGPSHTSEGPRAQAWIRTRAGDADGLPASVEAYSALATPVHPVTIPVEVAEHPDGFLVVDFPEGVPAHVLCNLVGWIDDGSRSTVGYLTAPSTGVRYQLVPDGDNVAGDTLRGAGDDGSRVEVYLPDGTVRPVAWAAEQAEPDRSEATLRHRFEVTVDGHEGFGNPAFVVTGTPPPVPTQERSRVDAALWALAEDPEGGLGLLFRPDQEAMPLPVEELERRHGAALRFATSDDHDQWLLVRPDGGWLEVTHDDADVIAYATGAHLAAELLLRASEDVVTDDDLRRFARALGLPLDAAAWTREGGAADYDAWKAQLVDRIVDATS